MQTPTANVHGQLRKNNDIYTVHCGSEKFMQHLPAPSQAPSPDHSSMTGDFRCISWISPKTPYLLFLPASSPFKGPIFERLDFSASHESVFVTSGVGYCLHHDLEEKMSLLENALYAVLRAMFAEYQGPSLEQVSPPRLPSQFGYRKPWRSRESASAVARQSRDAFLPLLAYIAMMFALLDHPRSDPSWRLHVIAASQVHPQWFADLELSAAGNMATSRLGGIIDLTLEWPYPMDVVLMVCLGRLNMPLYLFWGPITRVPSCPVPSILTEMEFLLDDAEIQYLRSLPGTVSFSAWDRCGEKYISRRLVTTRPASLASPLSTASDTADPNAGHVSACRHGEGDAIRAFIARRRAKHEKWALTETAQHRASRLSREASAAKGNPPGNKGAKVFVWEEENRFLVRQSLNCALAELRWTDFTPAQRYYDGWEDEWDLCTALAPEEKAELCDDAGGEGYVSESRNPASPSSGITGPDASTSCAFPFISEPILIRPHSTADDLQAAYALWKQDIRDDDQFEPFLNMGDVPFCRFGFTSPIAPKEYQDTLRPDFYARSLGDEQWAGLTQAKLTNLPALLASLLKARSLEDVPWELLDLRQAEADISVHTWAVNVRREILNDEVFYTIQPSNPDNCHELYILLSSATTTLEVVRQGWGSSSVHEIVAELFRRGVEFRLCRRGPLYPISYPIRFQTGLGMRPVGYSPTHLDYLAYKTRRDAFLQSPRGCVARFAGGIVGRLAARLTNDHDHLAACGPSEEVPGTGLRYWDGHSETAYWDDGLTPEEIELICGVYTVRTGLKSSAEEDGWQKKDISWWPKPSAFSLSGLNIGWWSPDCERWYQKRHLEIDGGQAKAKLWTNGEWVKKIRFIQKSREVAVANDKLAANYLRTRLCES